MALWWPKSGVKLFQGRPAVYSIAHIENRSNEGGKSGPGMPGMAAVVVVRHGRWSVAHQAAARALDRWAAAWLE